MDRRNRVSASFAVNTSRLADPWGGRRDCLSAGSPKRVYEGLSSRFTIAGQLWVSEEQAAGWIAYEKTRFVVAHLATHPAIGAWTQYRLFRTSEIVNRYPHSG
jgi:hypothetical protein